MQHTTNDQLMKKTPVYGELLAYQEILRNRCSDNKKDSVRQNQLDVINRMTTRLLEMNINNMPANEISQYIKDQIRDNDKVLEAHHKSIGGFISKLINRETTAFKLLRKHLCEWDA